MRPDLRDGIRAASQLRKQVSAYALPLQRMAEKVQPPPSTVVQSWSLCRESR
jgi:hypothetical protein